MKIDKLDVEIIKNLQQDARLSFRELGQKLNVPHTTVFTRADRLVEKGIIKNFSAILHPHELGLQAAYIVVDAAPAHSRDTAEYIAKFDETRKVFRTFDGKIIAEVLVPDKHKGLEDFLNRLNLNPVKVLPVHDVVKFEQKIQDSALEKLL